MSDTTVRIEFSDLLSLLHYAEIVPGRLLMDGEWPHYDALTRRVADLLRNQDQHGHVPLAKDTA